MSVRLTVSTQDLDDRKKIPPYYGKEITPNYLLWTMLEKSLGMII